LAYGLEQWRYLFPVFLAIRRARPQGGRLLDVGCGAGIFTALLAHHGYEVLGIDEDPDIVALASEMAAHLRSPARVERGSASDLTPYYDRFDLAYSLGVLEHFAAPETVRLIGQQARCAPLVLVVVPTRFARYAAPVTDERLYRLGQLRRLVGRAGLRVRESFVYGDVPTATARNLERLFPAILYRKLQRVWTYGMNIGCVGMRA
jgi:SAM-dependent methyltransferase